MKSFPFYRLDCISRHSPNLYDRGGFDPGRRLDPFCSTARNKIEEAIADVDRALKKRGLGELPKHLYNYYK